MRLFTAIDLPAEILLRLERLLSSLRPEALIHWSPLDNLHITTRFIGEWPESRLGELNDALAGLAPRAPFDIELRQFGWFPNHKSPRVLWAGVHAGPALTELIAETEQRLVPLGLAQSESPQQPHLTLARIRNAVPLEKLRKRVDELQSASLGTFPVQHFSLFRSDPGSNASIYRRLRDFQFVP
jgi:2'-5' RNA ligase